jgi:hypothetical protein
MTPTSAQQTLPIISDDEKAYLLLTTTGSYTQFNGRVLAYKECVSSTSALLNGERVIGRLLQIRKNAGACGMDIFLIRKPCGKLVTVENDILNVLPNTLPDLEQDKPSVEYTIGQDYPATGFIIENSPRIHTSAPTTTFSVAVTTTP